MNLIGSNYDVIFYGIIFLSALWAMFIGGGDEILSLGVWFSAIWLMRTHGNFITARLPNSISNEILRSAIAFILFFIVFAIIGTILKKICGTIIKSIGLSGLNCVLGIIFGIARGILVCSVLVLVIIIFKLDPGNSFEKSKLFPILHPVITWVAHAIPQQI